jgi:alpha-tubulin suppressor-like RCC1 family protein
MPSEQGIQAWLRGSNARAASVKIMYEPQPTPRKISALAEKTIRVVACGHNHTLALDTEQAAYTWGEPAASAMYVGMYG